MAISEKSIKILWSNAAGLCAFPECRERLALPGSDEYTAHTIGEMAHICGAKLGSNRHDFGQSAEQRDDYTNLILLCPTHHRTIDRKENEARFPVDMLKRMKTEHEAFVLLRLAKDPLDTRAAVAAAIAPLLEENRQAWLSFGPLSDIARKNPQSSSAHATWLSERLTTIIPNNRRISAVLRGASGVFMPADRPAVAAFLQHAKSYETWVSGEASYEGVLRFPTSFADLIEEAEGARV